VLDDADRTWHPDNVKIAGRSRSVNAYRIDCPMKGRNMDDVIRHIASKIKELREAAHVSQTALAAKLGVTPNTVSRWESATYQPSVKDLERLSRVLGKPLWAFLPSELEPPTEGQRALLSATGDLPEEDIEELVRYVDFVRARAALRSKRRSG
jgi:transcriptional regulator with XRE-family HTH domain